VLCVSKGTYDRETARGTRERERKNLPDDLERLVDVFGSGRIFPVKELEQSPVPPPSVLPHLSWSTSIWLDVEARGDFIRIGNRRIVGSAVAIVETTACRKELGYGTRDDRNGPSGGRVTCGTP
jgi:hypothetical protein